MPHFFHLLFTFFWMIIINIMNFFFGSQDAWAICRIFKKANTMAQRALSHSWVSSLPDTTASDILTQGAHCAQFSSENISCTTELGSVFQICSNNDLQQPSTGSFSALDMPSYKPINPIVYESSLFPPSNGDLTNNFMFSPHEMSGPTKSTLDATSVLLNPALIGAVSKPSDSIDFEGQQQQFGGFSISLTQDMQDNMSTAEEDAGLRKNPSAIQDNNQWGTFRSIGFPFSFPSNLPDTWKSNLPWDSPPCPSEMSTTYSTNKCYT